MDAPHHELRFHDWLAILDQFYAFIAARGAAGQLTLTGGEPFILRDLPAFLDHIRTRRPPIAVAILTNGTLIDADLARRLHAWSLRSVQVSLDGERTTHDAIRGEGNFARAVAGIEHLVRARVRVVISFTAHRGNFREFPAIARLGQELGVARVWADRLIPQGRGAEMWDNLLSPEETQEFVQLMAQARAGTATGAWNRLVTRQRTEVGMDRALQFHYGGGQPYRCPAGGALIALMPNGDVYPCRRMPVRVGNLLENSLEELYQCDLFRALRDQSRICAGCERCLYAHRCGGGLHCLALAVTGDPFQADPGCWLVRQPSPEAHSVA